MQRARWVAALVALVAATGCAQRGDSADVTQVVERAKETSEAEDREDAGLEAAIDQMLDLGSAGIASSVSEDESACLESAVVEHEIDVEAAMADPDAIEERVRFGELLLECLDDTTPLARLLSNAFKAVAPSLVLTEAEGKCLLDEIIANAEEPARLLIAMDGPASDLQVLFDAAEDCFSADHFATFMGEEGTGPQNYGDDDRLDSMQDDCEGGELRACDLLYMASTPGSDYEQVAVTCGGTEEDTGEFCSPGPELSDTGFAPSDSPGLEVLADDCEESDLTACDLLYLLVAPGHELENVGFTCGGRIAVGAIPDCRTRLG